MYVLSFSTQSNQLCIFYRHVTVINVEKTIAGVMMVGLYFLTFEKILKCTIEM